MVPPHVNEALLKRYKELPVNHCYATGSLFPGSTELISSYNSDTLSRNRTLSEEIMDILHLVDCLEELFNNSKPIPLPGVVVDENSFMDIIDQMKFPF